jgi:hypothetical protein
MPDVTPTTIFQVDAVAGNHVVLPTDAKQLPGSRILDDRLLKQELVLFVPSGPACRAGLRPGLREAVHRFWPPAEEH